MPKSKTCVSHFEPRSSLPGLPPTTPSHHGQAPEGPLNFYSVILVGKPSTSYSYLTFFLLLPPRLSLITNSATQLEKNLKDRGPEEDRPTFFAILFLLLPTKRGYFLSRLSSVSQHHVQEKKERVYVF